MQSLSEHSTITLTLSKLISHFCTSNCIKGALHLTQPVTRTKKQNYSNTDLYKKKKKSIFISENHCTQRQPLNQILWNEKNCSSCNSVDGDKAISSHIQYIRNALGWLQLTREV